MDPGYHCEEFHKIFHHCIWDIPGTDAMRRLWPCFYKGMKVHGVIFLVNPSESDDRFKLAKHHLHVLLQEVELRLACFCIVVNNRDHENETRQGGRAQHLRNRASDTESNHEMDEIWYKLGLHEVSEEQRWRVQPFTFNVLGLRSDHDPVWTEVLQFAKNTLSNPSSYDIKF